MKFGAPVTGDRLMNGPDNRKTAEVMSRHWLFHRHGHFRED